MEIRTIFRLLKKWGWLAVLLALVGSAGAYLTSNRKASSEESLYQAQVTLLVGGWLNNPNPSFFNLWTGQELTQTYSYLLTTYDFLEIILRNSDLDITPQELSAMLSIETIPEASLLFVTITHFDPAEAVSIANEVAQQLVQYGPGGFSQEQQRHIDLVRSEIDNLNARVFELRQQLNSVDDRLITATDAEEIERLQEERRVITQRINLALKNIAEFSESITILQNQSNSFQIVQSTSQAMPIIYRSSFPTKRVLFGAAAGVALIAGIAFVIEYFDNTIKTSNDVNRSISAPILGEVVQFGGRRTSSNQRLITYWDPMSPISESYRVIRTNLLFSINDQDVSNIVITSPGPVEGKSVTAANLAVAFANSGYQVLLVDADFRRPRIHEFFGLPNELGLTTLLHTDPTKMLPSTFGTIPKELKSCIQDTSVPNLRVITSGYKLVNPTEMLSSVTMQLWARAFQSGNDVVIYDTPPNLVVADSASLAVATRASVTLVVRANKTRRSAISRSTEQLNHLNVNILGCVVNAIDPTESRYGYGGYYYYYGSGRNRSGRRRRTD